MKKFENPMLQIVSINKSDIIVTSLGVGSDIQSGETIEAATAGRRMDDWDGGY